MYSTTLTLSAVTPADVAPPLSPSNGSTQGGAYTETSLSLPVSVSQFRPQSMSSVSPSSSAFCHVIGPDAISSSPLAVAPSVAASSSPSSFPPPNTTTAAPMSARTTTMGP